jgi:hypothetical protein
LVDQPVSQSSFLMTAHWATCAVLPTHFHIWTMHWQGGDLQGCGLRFVAKNWLASN